MRTRLAVLGLALALASPTLAGPGPVLTPDGRWVAALCSDGFGGTGLGVWDAATGERKASRSLVGVPSDLALSADGRTLAVASYGETVRLFSLPGAQAGAVLSTGRKAPSPRGDMVGGYRVEFAPDGRTLLTSGYSTGSPEPEPDARLWDVSAGKTRQRVPAPQGGKWDLVSLSPDGLFVAASGREARGGRLTSLWRSGDGQPLRTLHGVALPPEADPFSSQGLLALVSTTGIRIWDVEDDREQVVLEGAGEGLPWRQELAWSADGSRLAVAGEAEVGVWSIPSGRRLATVPGLGKPREAPAQVLLQADGSRLYVLDFEGRLQAWALPPGAPAPGRRLWERGAEAEPGGRPTGLALQGEVLAVQSPADLVLLDAATGKVSRRLLEPATSGGR